MRLRSGHTTVELQAIFRPRDAGTSSTALKGYRPRAVSRYEWLLFFHVAGAFAVVAGLVLLTVAVLAASRRERPSEIALMLGLARLNGVLFGLGGFVILIFGLWLVFDLDSYDITDGWVLAGLGFWFLASFAGTRADQAYVRTRRRAVELAAEGDAPSSELAAGLRSTRAFTLLGLTLAAVLGALVVMIFKPGA
jgi:uncharacterized membrane protein